MPMIEPPGFNTRWQRIRAVWCALLARIGRRGAKLITWGVTWVVFGYAVLTLPGVVTGYGVLDRIPPHIIGACWIACGFIGIGHCLVRKPGRDRYGFMALILPAFVWAVGAWWGWIIWLVWHGSDGSPYGWANAVIWSAFAASVIITAGWPESPRSGDRR